MKRPFHGGVDRRRGQDSYPAAQRQALSRAAHDATKTMLAAHRRPDGTIAASPDDLRVGPKLSTKPAGGNVVALDYIVTKQNRFYVVTYDGIDPTNGRERRSWHLAGDSREDAEAIAANLTHGTDQRRAGACSAATAPPTSNDARPRPSGRMPAAKPLPGTMQIVGRPLPDLGTWLVHPSPARTCG